MNPLSRTTSTHSSQGISMRWLSAFSRRSIFSGLCNCAGLLASAVLISSLCTESAQAQATVPNILPSASSSSPAAVKKVATPAERAASQKKALKEFFPDGLIDKEGKPVSTSTLEGKMLGIYFSASWCGPCRVFSPSLVAHRDKYKADFEVVLVGSDRTDDSHLKYLSKMPWPAMKLNSPAANALKKRFSLRGIPMLVLINDDGTVNTVNGRNVIAAKKNMTTLRKASATQAAPTPVASANTIPKLPPMSLAEHFKDGLITTDNEEYDMENLEDKIIGLYFSAGWCGPCQRFTPMLKNYYEKNKKDFELIFVSSDRSKKEFDAYRAKAKMTWPAIDFGNESIATLTKRYGARSIPALVLIKGNGELITRDARSLIQSTKPLDVRALNAGEIEIYKCGRCNKPHIRKLN